MKTLYFKTDLTLGDYKSLCRLQSKASLAIISLAGGAFIALMLMRLLAASIPLLIIIGVAGCAVVYLLMSIYISWRAARIYGMSSVSDLLELTLNDEGITQLSQNGELKLEWGEIYKVVEVKSCYFVFLTKSKALYFPKRNFDSIEHEKEFVEWVVEKVHPGRIKFKK